ncbi:hypothetical protein ACRJ4W_35560 [Streptomyces sp. GLT-R25]
MQKLLCGKGLCGVQLLQKVLHAVGRAGQERSERVVVFCHVGEVGTLEECGGLVQLGGYALVFVAETAEAFLAGAEVLGAVFDSFFGLLQLRGELVQAGFGLQGPLALLQFFEFEDGRLPVDLVVVLDVREEGESIADAGPRTLLLLEVAGAFGDLGALLSEALCFLEEGCQLGLVRPAEDPGTAVVDPGGVVLFVPAASVLDQALLGDSRAGGAGEGVQVARAVVISPGAQLGWRASREPSCPG